MSAIFLGFNLSPLNMIVIIYISGKDHESSMVDNGERILLVFTIRTYLT